MLVGTYHCHCRLQTPAHLPAFKGSTLRGGFGHTLRKVACALRRQTCQDCLLGSSCAYAVIFETQPASRAGQEDAARIAARPHPYVFMVPQDARQEFAAGDEFEFGLGLFGKANEYLPHIVYAIENLGGLGLGRSSANGLGRFSLVAVTRDGEEIYRADTKVLRHASPLIPLSVQPAAHGGATSLAIDLITPLRLKQDNHFQTSLPFHMLVRAALRRISSLENAYGEGEPALDYAGLVRRAQNVTLGHSTCQWVELERYSNRQKTAMLMGGLLGTLRYEGNLDEYVPLLKYCEKTHLGKQTSFGLGQIQVHI